MTYTKNLVLCVLMLMTSGFATFVLVGLLTGLINSGLGFPFTIDSVVLIFSSSGLELGPPGMLYCCKRMLCAGPLFEAIMASDGVGAGFVGAGRMIWC